MDSVSWTFKYFSDSWRVDNRGTGLSFWEWRHRCVCASGSWKSQPAGLVQLVYGVRVLKAWRIPWESCQDLTMWTESDGGTWFSTNLLEVPGPLQTWGPPWKGWLSAFHTIEVCYWNCFCTDFSCPFLFHPPLGANFTSLHLKWPSLRIPAFGFKGFACCGMETLATGYLTFRVCVCKSMYLFINAELFVSEYTT